MREPVMDPDAALEAARNAASNIARWLEDPDFEVDAIEEAAGLTQHFQALDEWLGKGGFLPDAWKHPGLRQARE